MPTANPPATAAPRPQIFGPYQRGESFRCIVEVAGQRTTLPNAPTEKRAIRLAEQFIEMMRATAPVSIQEAMERYREYMLLNDRKPATVTTTQYRLRRFFGDTAQSVKTLTPTKCAAMYTALVKQQKADTHRNTLAEAKTFARWLVSEKLLRENPTEGIKPSGRRSRGKEQLTRDEAARWTDAALALATSGDDGALAAVMTLLMGLRAGEVVVRTVRDVDANGTRLRVRKTKTRAGERDPFIPSVLQPLIALRCQGKQPDELLFPARSRTGQIKPHDVSWVRKHVQQICRDTNVPRVCSHSMRGLHADLGVGAGMLPEVVAKSIGHSTPGMTMRHYALPSTLHDAQTDRTTQALGLGSRAPHLRVVS